MCLSFLTIVIDLHSNLTLRIQQTSLRFYNVFFISIYNYLRNTYICTHKIKIYKISKGTIYLICVSSELPAVITKINIAEDKKLFLFIRVRVRACVSITTICILLTDSIHDTMKLLLQFSYHMRYYQLSLKKCICIYECMNVCIYKLSYFCYVISKIKIINLLK